MADVKWIKITTDIFDDEKILLIENLPAADSIITMWFKLLILAGKQNNSGVFLMNDKIAYTDEMLSTIFRRDINTVRLALKTFEEFGMIEIVNGVITIPKWGKHQTSDVAISDKDKEEDKEKDKEKKKCSKEHKKEIVYFPNDETLNQAFVDFIKMRKQIKKPMTDRAIKMAINKLKKLCEIPFSDEINCELAVKILEQSILNCWQDLYPLKKNNIKTGERDILSEWRNA